MIYLLVANQANVKVLARKVYGFLYYKQENTVIYPQEERVLTSSSTFSFKLIVQAKSSERDELVIAERKIDSSKKLVIDKCDEVGEQKLHWLDVSENDEEIREQMRVEKCREPIFTDFNKHTDLYILLEIPRDANADMISRAYRRKMLENHPDKGGCQQLAQLLNFAYSVLINDEQKKEYDRKLQGGNLSGRMQLLWQDLTSGWQRGAQLAISVAAIGSGVAFAAAIIASGGLVIAGLGVGGPLVCFGLSSLSYSFGTESAINTAKNTWRSWLLQGGVGAAASVIGSLVVCGLGAFCPPLLSHPMLITSIASGLESALIGGIHQFGFNRDSGDLENKLANVLILTVVGVVLGAIIGQLIPSNAINLSDEFGAVLTNSGETIMGTIKALRASAFRLAARTVRSIPLHAWNALTYVKDRQKAYFTLGQAYFQVDFDIPNAQVQCHIVYTSIVKKKKETSEETFSIQSRGKHAHIIKWRSELRLITIKFMLKLTSEDESTELTKYDRKASRWIEPAVAHKIDLINLESLDVKIREVKCSDQQSKPAIVDIQTIVFTDKDPYGIEFYEDLNDVRRDRTYTYGSLCFIGERCENVIMEIGYRSENGPVFKKDERRVNQVYNIESNLSRDNCYISVKFKSGNSYFCSWDRRNSQWTATSQVQEFKIHYPSNFRFYVEKPVVGWPRVVKVYDCRSVIEWIELFEDDLNPPAVPNEQVSQENEKQKLVQKLEGLAEKEQQSAADPVATNGINDLANVLALIPEKWTEGNEADESKTSMTQQFVCRVMKDTGERIRDSEQPPE